MRLSFNEIRARASSFAKTYAEATYEKGETQSFYNDFFGIFGVERRSVARYEEHVKKLNNRSGFIDLFWPRVLLVEQKSAGRDLNKAREQAGEYFDALKESQRPRFQLLCDFQTFQLLDRDTREDGADTGPLIAQLFEILNTPEDQRQNNLDEDFARFPYVNGALFSDLVRTPSFDAEMRERLIEASRFNWSGISPAIFGSLFQSVMDKAERRKAGAHYTTEKNIMKVIGPLFMDGLHAAFGKLKARKNNRIKMLQAFHKKLAGLTFLDPACGCGNFLIITYRELRLLEIEVLREIHRDDLIKLKGGATELPLKSLLKIDVDQFYGIEFEEFPARIAETAMWMMDHIMNTQASLEFGAPFLRIPLRKSPSITHGDALELDWATLITPDKCSYIIGNPPFIGQSYQSKDQREQMRKLTNPNGKTGSPLDYVGAWFLKAGDYTQNHNVPFAFVSTNSITQGEQVGLLWPTIFDHYKLEIAFAHQTFAWGSEARGTAAVHVIVLGLEPCKHARVTKRLFAYPDIKGDPTESQHKAISPYLFDASGLGNPHVVVVTARKPLSERPRMFNGPKSTDGGHYIFRGDEIDEFVAQEPKAAQFMRPYIGAAEFLNSKRRAILYLADASPSDLKAMPLVMERIAKVRDFRAASKKPATQKLAEFPTLLEGKSIPDQPFLAIPQVSSERRQYVPFGWMEPPTIPSDKLRYIANILMPEFAILTSAMHMAWMRTVTGRMKSDYMYSVGVVYNTFPMPTAKDLSKLEPHAQAILDARAKYPDATLADLYDPDVMPADLRKAHRANDLAVDRLYRKGKFASERERVEHLFMLYEKMVDGMLAETKKPRKGKTKPDTGHIR